jgi:class 3 adenylate cyclase
MLSHEQKQEITAIVRRALNKAERIWRKHGMAMDAMTRADEAVTKREVVPARIPGHGTVESGKEEVGEFIALVADMRGSSNHLLVAIADTKATGLERIFYETSALLPALDQTIQFERGAVTEYLGDGLLALFAVPENDKESVLRAAYRVAENCIADTREIVNNALSERYKLPPVSLGVGMALSKAVVSLAGIEGKSHPKVFGRCVWEATKLSDGKNCIKVDNWLRKTWPVSKGGGLRFTTTKGRGVAEGFVVIRKPEQ